MPITKKSTGDLVTKQDAMDLTKLGQENIPNMLKLIGEKIKALKGDNPTGTKTTGDLRPFGKIKDIKTVQKLVAAHSMVVNKAAAYRKSAEMTKVDLKKYPFKLDGSSESAWVADIEVAIAKVANKVELTKLTNAKKLLEENLSAKDKLAKDLLAIQNDFIL